MQDQRFLCKTRGFCASCTWEIGGDCLWKMRGFCARSEVFVEDTELAGSQQGPEPWRLEELNEVKDYYAGSEVSVQDPSFLCKMQTMPCRNKGLTLGGQRGVVQV